MTESKDGYPVHYPVPGQDADSCDDMSSVAKHYVKSVSETENRSEDVGWPNISKMITPWTIE